ncbi:MAG: cell division protein FtsA [Candidatus Cloacimonetes bacterium]|nr:cell division protein FtsA [Candidatus Cloacimonadota bacterium]
MKRTTVVTAVDLGTTKISVIIARLLDNGKFDLLGVGDAQSVGIENGIIKDIRKTSDSIRKALEIAEKNAEIKASNIFVGIAGEHIKSTNAISRLSLTDPIRGEPAEINQEHILKVIRNAEESVITQEGDKSQKIIHAIPQYFEVDNQDNIIDPADMSGYILTAHVHVILSDINALRNVNKCFELIGYKPESIILEPVASSKAVLTNDEMYLGCVLLDIGGGTTDIACFYKNSIRFSLIKPMGGNNVTNDIALGLTTTQKFAEKLKIQYGDVIDSEVDENAVIEVEGMGGRQQKPQKLKYFIKIIESRVREILEIAYTSIANIKYHDYMSAGLIITGGTSLLSHIEYLAKDVFNMEVRIGYPDLSRLNNPTKHLKDPKYATAVGLLYHAADLVAAEEVDNNVIPPARSIVKMTKGIIKTIYDNIADFF